MMYCLLVVKQDTVQLDLCPHLGGFLLTKLKSQRSTHLKLLGESVGGVELHDVLDKLLHRQRLVTI